MTARVVRPGFARTACLALATTLAACARPMPLAGCAKDVDCKGARVCDRGSCVDPTSFSSGHGPPAAAREIVAPSAMTAPQAGSAALQHAPPPLVLPGASPELHVDYRHSGRSRFTVTTSAPRVHVRLKTGGTVFSSPAITSDGLAIFGSHDRSIRAALLVDGNLAAVKWTRATGDMVWSAPALGPATPLAQGPLADGGLSLPGDGGVAPARVDAGVAGVAAPTVYVGSDDDHLYALDAATGEVRFTYLAGPCKKAIGFGPEAARCDVDGVTVGPDGTIYFVADGAYALHPDGRLAFRFALRTHCAGAPAIGPDGAVYFGCQDGRLYALSPDGQKRWDFRTGDDVDSPPAVAPDGTVYVGSDDHKLYALSPNGALQFAVKTGGDVRGAPAIADDGTVYFGSFDDNLYAIHPDGSIAWSFGTADRILSSPTIDAAGTILVGSEDDRLYAIGRDGKLLWSVLFDGDVDGTPAIGDGGTIYVGSDDKCLHILR